jgi:hypothetical protein
VTELRNHVLSWCGLSFLSKSAFSVAVSACIKLSLVVSAETFCLSVYPLVDLVFLTFSSHGQVEVVHEMPSFDQTRSSSRWGSVGSLISARKRVGVLACSTAFFQLSLVVAFEHLVGH